MDRGHASPTVREESPARPLRVLMVEDDVEDARALLCALREHGFDPRAQVVCRRAEVVEALEGDIWDVVCADYHLADFSGLAALRLLRERDPDVPFIIVSGTIDESVAVEALKVGASDYVLKGNMTRLGPAVDRSLREATERRKVRAAEERLRESEERYRELVENANDVIFTIDLQGNFTGINRAGEMISGYTKEEVQDLNMAQVLAPESLSVAFQMIRVKLEDNRATTYELEMIAKDGHRVPLEVSTRLIVQNGVPVGVQGIARDITERKEAAQALREREERYRGIFENASDLVYTHDFRGNITSANRAVELLLGYTREEAETLNIADVVVPEHLSRAREMIRRKLEDADPTTYELDIATKEGRAITVEINSQLIYEGGQPVGIQGIARDVTERRKATAELRAREQKQAAVAGLGQAALEAEDLQALFALAASAVTETLDVELSSVTELLPDGRDLLPRAGVGWDPGLVGEVTVGAGGQSLAGYALLSSEPVIMTDARQEERFQVPQVLHDHRVVSGASVIIPGRDGPFGVLNAFSTASREFSQDDVHFLQSVAHVLAAAIERHHLEEARAREARQLTTRILQAQEEERKRIARELHDETAQSLSTLLINLDLLEPHIPADASLLRAGFERVGEIARRTLDETRALSHDLRPTILDDVGLEAALRWFAAEFQRTFGTEVEVVTRFEADARLAPETEVALFRIAQEALTNCGKHARAEHVRVTLLVEEHAISLQVQDDGIGFDPERVQQPTRLGRLGLYGMAERAELLGGTLQITAAPGRGTCVALTVPWEEREALS